MEALLSLLVIASLITLAGLYLLQLLLGTQVTRPIYKGVKNIMKYCIRLSFRGVGLAGYTSFYAVREVLDWHEDKRDGIPHVRKPFELPSWVKYDWKDPRARGKRRRWIGLGRWT